MYGTVEQCKISIFSDAQFNLYQWEQNFRLIICYNTQLSVFDKILEIHICIEFFFFSVSQSMCTFSNNVLTEKKSLVCSSNCIAIIFFLYTVVHQ